MEVIKKGNVTIFRNEPIRLGNTAWIFTGKPKEKEKEDGNNENES